MRLLFAGDTHGSHRQLEYLVAAAKQVGAERIVQLGDFGFFWDHAVRVESVSHLLQDNDIDLWFLDGNHENFDLMAEFGADPDGDAPVEVLPRLTYMPRGSTFEVGKTTFMAFGGAVSVDRAHRTPGRDWWVQENIKEHQVRKVEDSGIKVDVLLSHDTPHLPEVIVKDIERQYGPGWKQERASDQNRQQLRRVFDAVQPRHGIHGHYHVKATYFVDGAHPATIDCLNMNGTGTDSWIGWYGR